MVDINAWEIVVNEFMQSLGEWLALPMQFITSLGYEYFFVLLLPTLYWSFDQMVGLRLGIILMLGNFTNAFFKILFHTPRPYWISESIKAYTEEHSFGLPSGHAQIAATVWGWLAVEIKKRWVTIAALVLIFLIGVSRLYLGVHFLSDVLLGWLLGGLLVWAFAAWHKPVGEWIAQQSLWMRISLVILGTAVLIGLMLAVHGYVTPWSPDSEWVVDSNDIDPLDLSGVFTVGGTWFGMLIGYILLTEMRGHFLASEGTWRRLVRLMVGLLGLIMLYFGLGLIFPDNGDLASYTLRFIRYTLIGMWVSWIGPLVFEKLNLLTFERPSS